MNANAYGGQLAEVLEWVEVATATGTERRDPDAARLRLPQLEPRPRARSSPAPPSRSPPATRTRSGRRWPRCATAAARPSPPGSRPSARPSRTPRTSAPRAAPPASCSRRPAAAASRIGGARFSEKHANFVENMGEATTADVLALMAEGRRRVHEKLRRRARARGPGAGRRRAWPGGWEPVKSRAGSLAVAAAGRRCVAIVAVAVYWFALRGSSTPTADGAADPTPSPRSANGKTRGRWSATTASSLGFRPVAQEGPASCRVLPLDEAAEGRAASAGHVLEAGPRPRRRADGAPALHRTQPTTAKRGRRRTHLGDRNPLRRRLAKRPGSGKRRPRCSPIRR